MVRMRRALLQRGLGIAAEDRASRPMRLAARASFNGASASLPRIGRPSVSALGCARPASTGPRHRCRGSASTAAARVPPACRLQRGLGIAAED